MTNSLSALPRRLDQMAQQNPAYLLQEYNNEFWEPLYVDSMIEQMAAHKFSYLGTATLSESLDGVLPKAIQELLASQTGPESRELLRDYAVNKVFRRDLYVKGSSRPSQLQQQLRLQQFRFRLNPLKPRPASGETYKIAAGNYILEGRADLYGGLLDSLSTQQEGLSLAELTDSQPASVRADVLQAATMLLHEQWVFFEKEVSDRAPSQRLNRALVNAACDGLPYQHIALPGIGAAPAISDIDWQLLKVMLQSPDASAEECIRQVAKGLSSLGKTPAKNGKALASTAEQNALLTEVYNDFHRLKWPFFQSMGAF